METINPTGDGKSWEKAWERQKGGSPAQEPHSHILAILQNSSRLEPEKASSIAKSAGSSIHAGQNPLEASKVHRPID